MRNVDSRALRESFTKEELVKLFGVYQLRGLVRQTERQRSIKYDAGNDRAGNALSRAHDKYFEEYEKMSGENIGINSKFRRLLQMGNRD
ncbi:MAG TPA: hypothetical protein VLH19_02815 [Patescibacteria group bacterium]|nr:hypothetical protein [Patescibacteria group bacterium]